MPYKQFHASPKLLALFTAKFNDRLGKVDRYTPQEVLDRLGILERGAKLNAQLSDRMNSI